MRWCEKKNIATDDNRLMHIACGVPKVTNTHSEYVISIAFPLQEWLQNALLCFNDYVFRQETASAQF